MQQIQSLIEDKMYLALNMICQYHSVAAKFSGVYY